MDKETTLQQGLPRSKHHPLTSGLQFRMTLSYALTTFGAMLSVEVLAGIGLVLLLTYTTFVDSVFIGGAQRTAKLYALAASAQAGGAVLDPHTTFEPNRPASLALPKAYFSDQSYIQYVGSHPSEAPANSFALLITPHAQVLASTYPAQFTASTPVSRLLPDKTGLIMSALSGTAGSVVVATTQGRVISATEPVWSKEKIIGAVYVQLPIISGWILLRGISKIWLASAVLLLLLTLLIGALFGLITTRGLVRCLRRLATATTRFANGDYTERVRVSRRDEVGQLEEHFNRMAEQLIESINQRQALAGQNARLAERDRLARDLHDSVKQQVFAASMQLGAAISLLDVKREVVRQHLMEAENLANQVLQELTTLIQELRPLALQDKGLTAAMREYVATWSRQQGITAEMHAVDICAIPLEIEEALWRVAQEALSNIARHSHASKVEVSLTCEQGSVRLAVVDNGQGFDNVATASGVGLHSMQERLQALGGTLTVQSKTGEGTRVLAQCPYTQIPPGFPIEPASHASQ
jgi:two-component system, NarL family, sensor histidine kinase LiaS